MDLEDRVKLKRRTDVCLDSNREVMGVLCDRKVEIINECLRQLDQKPLIPYQEGKHVYLGLVGNCPTDCGGYVSFADNHICVNHYKIRQYLLRKRGQK